jgi:hypothetical protein
MDRISGANYALVNGLRMWQDRNLAANQEGTFGNALFFNGVQEELMGIIAAGGETPNAANNGQVLAAILSLVRQGGAGGGSLTVSGSVVSGYFFVPLVSGPPIVVNFGTFAFSGTSSPTTSILLGASFPTQYLGGFANDGGSFCLSYGISAGADLSHIDIYCPAIPSNASVGGFWMALGN